VIRRPGITTILGTFCTSTAEFKAQVQRTQGQTDFLRIDKNVLILEPSLAGSSGGAGEFATVLAGVDAGGGDDAEDMIARESGRR